MTVGAVTEEQIKKYIENQSDELGSFKVWDEAEESEKDMADLQSDSSGKSLNESRLTNAVAEGLNRIIRIVKNRASGFRSLQAFIDMIFLTVGDLDIPA